MTEVARRAVLRSLRQVAEKRLSLPRGALKLLLAASHTAQTTNILKAALLASGLRVGYPCW